MPKSRSTIFRYAKKRHEIIYGSINKSWEAHRATFISECPEPKDSRAEYEVMIVPPGISSFKEAEEKANSLADNLKSDTEDGSTGRKRQITKPVRFTNSAECNDGDVSSDESLLGSPVPKERTPSPITTKPQDKLGVLEEPDETPPKRLKIAPVSGRLLYSPKRQLNKQILTDQLVSTPPRLTQARCEKCACTCALATSVSAIATDQAFLRVTLTEIQKHLATIARTMANQPLIEELPNDPGTLNLPIKTIEEFQARECALANATNQAALVRKMSKVGGTNLGDNTRRVMSRLLTNDLAACFSYIGKKGKKAFQPTYLNIVVFDAVKKQYPESNEREVQKLISDWLRLAKTRIARSAGTKPSQVQPRNNPSSYEHQSYSEGN